MNTAGFKFTKNLDRPIKLAGFVLTGFDLEQEAAIKACIRARGGFTGDRVDGCTACLIVNEDYDHQTVKYRQAWERKRCGEDISIISFAMFRRLCPEVDEKTPPPIAVLDPIPFGPGELVFENALWSALLPGWEEENRLKKEIKARGGYYGSPLKKTHYVIYNLLEPSRSRFYDSVKKRETAGELRMLPLPVYDIWTAEEPLTAFAHEPVGGKRIAAMHYLICPQPWQKEEPLCRKLESIAVKDHRLLLPKLFELGEHSAVFRLLELLRAKAAQTQNTEETRRVGELAQTFCDKAIALNDADASFRWLEFIRTFLPAPDADDLYRLDPLPPEKPETVFGKLKKRLTGDDK